jgi:hypothetical protein
VYEINVAYIDASLYMTIGQSMVASICTKKISFIDASLHMPTEHAIGGS